jgi:uncharacterized protein (DUF2249 family)
VTTSDPAQPAAQAKAPLCTLPDKHDVLVTRDFPGQPARHLGAEETMLAAPGVPGRVTATLARGGRPHRRYPFTEGPVIDLDALPAGQAVDAAVDRLLRLSQGEHVELRSRSDPYRLWRQVAEFAPGGYSLVYLHEGPKRWAVQVTRQTGPEA